MKVYLVISEQGYSADYSTRIEYASLDEIKAYRYAEDYIERYKQKKEIIKSIGSKIDDLDYDLDMSDKERDDKVLCILKQYGLTEEDYEDRWLDIEDVKVIGMEID
jgi:hypothetical protein